MQGISLYQFEYQFIPQLIKFAHDNMPTFQEFISHLSNIDWIVNNVMPASNLQCDFDTSALAAEVAAANDKYIAVVYTFPVPAESPLARFGAVVLNEKGINYYTLEKSEYDGKIDWMLGRTTPAGHNNLGTVHDCVSPAEFVSLLEAKADI